MSPNKLSQLTDLTPQQLQAIDFLMLGYSHRQVGESVGLSRETITRWMLYHPGFQAEINRRRREMAENSLDRLRDLLPKALDTIEDALDDENNQNRCKIALELLKTAGPLSFPVVRFVTGPIDANSIILDRTREEHDLLRNLNRPTEYQLKDTIRGIKDRLKDEHLPVSITSDQSDRKEQVEADAASEKCIEGKIEPQNPENT